MVSVTEKRSLSPIYVCGPTASGKSTLAIELAHLLDGEIINADAYQLYRGMDILSAAPSCKEKEQARHHLYGVLDIEDTCDAMRYRSMALPVIKEVQSRGKTPIVTGGSGMYLKFLTHGPSPVPSGDNQLRAQLEKKSDLELAAKLISLDPEGAQMTNLENRRYVIRALEICILSGQKMSTIKSDWKKNNTQTEKELRGAYLLWDRDLLRDRINLRARLMLEAGAIDEVRQLGRASTTCEKAIGVSIIRSYLSGLTTLDECEERIAASTRQYAKRQRTWFGKEAWLTPCVIDTEGNSPASKLLRQWK